MRFLLDRDQVAAVLDVLLRHLALDEQDVARRIVAADLAGRVAQGAVVAHPVRHVMGQPRSALGAVVVGARCADLVGELLFPVHALGAVGNAEAVLDAEAGMGVLQLPGELVGADVETAPALGVSDEAGHGHRPLHHGRQRLAFLHVFPVARLGAADLLFGVELAGVGQLLVGVAAHRLAPQLGVLGALLARVVALGAEAPAVGAGDEVAFLVEEIDMVDLLHRAAGELRLMDDQVLEPRLGGDLVVAVDRLVPVPVRARPHGMDARQAADITRDDAAGREQERRQGDHVAELRLLRVFRHAPQRIVVADAMGVVADVVARRLVAPRLGGLADLDADALAQRIEPFLGDLRKAPFHCVRHFPFPLFLESCG